jgi:hypothetical protein
MYVHLESTARCRLQLKNNGTVFSDVLALCNLKKRPALLGSHPRQPAHRFFPSRAANLWLRNEKNTRCLNVPLPSRLICSFLSQVRKMHKPSEWGGLRRDARAVTLAAPTILHNNTLHACTLNSSENNSCCAARDLYDLPAERIITAAAELKKVLYQQTRIARIFWMYRAAAFFVLMRLMNLVVVFLRTKSACMPFPFMNMRPPTAINCNYLLNAQKLLCAPLWKD